jgi:hypothetical protein
MQIGELTITLKLEDFFTECTECGGTGGMRAKIHFGFAHPGGSSAAARQGPCPKCFGRGGKLTDDGQVLREFLQRLEQFEDPVA